MTGRSGNSVPFSRNLGDDEAGRRSEESFDGTVTCIGASRE